MSFLEKLQREAGKTPRQHTPTPREELDSLFDDAVKMALRLIEKHGCHFPFGMAISIDGERVNVAADDREMQDIEILFENIRRRIMDGIRQGQFRAIALAKNVAFRRAQNEPPTQSIQVTLDHREANACTCYLPYQIAQGRIITGELFATEPLERFFLDKAKFIVGLDGNIRGR